MSYGRSIKIKCQVQMLENNSKQVELFLYGKNIEELKGKENIKISSLDSLLSNINNYYDDEIYLNKLIIGEIAL